MDWLKCINRSSAKFRLKVLWLPLNVLSLASLTINQQYVFVLLIGYIIFSAGMYFVFPKAGVDAWKGLVPGLNLYELAGIVGRKKSHAWWMLFPIVNIFIFAALIIDLARSFGKHSFLHSLLAVVGAPFYALWLGFSKDAKYNGPILTEEKEFFSKLASAQEKNDTKTVSKLQATNIFKKSALREWAESIIFAVFAAAFIRMFLIEAYMIPTSSMEGSLKVGDFICKQSTLWRQIAYDLRNDSSIAQYDTYHQYGILPEKTKF